MIEIIGVIAFIYLVLAITFWTIYFICWLIKKICKAIWFIISFSFLDSTSESKDNNQPKKDYIEEYMETKEFKNSSCAKKELISNMQFVRKMFVDKFGEVNGEAIWQMYLKKELKNTKI